MSMELVLIKDYKVYTHDIVYVFYHFNIISINPSFLMQWSAV